MHRLWNGLEAASEGPGLLRGLGQSGQEPHVEQYRFRSCGCRAVMLPGPPRVLLTSYTGCKKGIKVIVGDAR